MEVVFLHLSDLHMCMKNETEAHIVIDALFRDIKRTGYKYDFVAFTGDLICHGDQGLSGERQYDLAETKLINPLMSIVGLPTHRFFFVPGNHEVARTKIQKFVDDDLTSKFQSTEQVNEFIDSLSSSQLLLKRLDDYWVYHNRLHEGNSNLSSKNGILVDHVIEKDGVRIGVACLNTSWGAYGGDDDRLKLLLGERQIDIAVPPISDCVLRIAMFHHPLSWLKPFDNEIVVRRLCREFQFVLTGHSHEAEAEETLHYMQKTVFCSGGALFQGRGNFNGYSIIRYDTSTGDAAVHLRQYFDKRREFDKALSIVEDGVAHYNLLDKQATTAQAKLLDSIFRIKGRVENYLNQGLITCMSPDTIAPKSIESLYVSPLFGEQPEGYTKSDQEVTYELEEILRRDENVLFVGGKEVGKTTLLNYICSWHLSVHNCQHRAPLIISCKQLPPGKNVFLKAISNYLIEFGEMEFDLEENLTIGNCVLLIDDVNLRDKRLMERLREFVSMYPLNRFYFTANGDLLQDLKLEDFPNLGVAYSTYYIYTFRRSQIRELVNKWFPSDLANDDDVFERVMRSLKGIGVPSTPMTVSLLLWIYEKGAVFEPINEATLVGRFIEVLLEKLNPAEVNYSRVDYRIKCDYLAYIASLILRSGDIGLDQDDFRRVSEDYFKSKGLPVTAEEVRQSMFDKGILVTRDQMVHFRYQCFLEYFTAYWMTEDDAFKRWVLEEDQYLKFSGTICYFLGINRKSNGVLELLETRLSKAFEEIDKQVDLETLGQMPVDAFLSRGIKPDQLHEDLSRSELSVQEKDAILDAAPPPKKLIKENPERRARIDIIQMLELYAQAIRNCELILVEDKARATKVCIEKYCRITGLMYLVSRQMIEQGEIVLDNFNRYVFTVGLPLYFQSLVLNSLGSRKLGPTIERLLQEDMSDFERLYLLALYADLRIQGYLEGVRTFAKKTKSGLIREVLLAKLLYYNAFYLNKSKKEKDTLVDVIAEVIVENTTGRRPRNLKSAVIGRILEIESKTANRQLIE